jgi:hypothetical protein
MIQRFPTRYCANLTTTKKEEERQGQNAKAKI